MELLLGSLALAASLALVQSDDASVGRVRPAEEAELATGAGVDSRLPNASRAPDGTNVLSWIESVAGAGGEAFPMLRCAYLASGRVEPAFDVARASGWVFTWTDPPLVRALGRERLVATYLVPNAGGAHGYGLRLVRSNDGGASWSEPVRLHDHDGAGEHGFASLVPAADGACDAVWLDGRGVDERGAGATALYLRRIDAEGELGEERVLDERVCDCCPTAAARAADGALLVAYRDRSDDELRDLAVLRVDADGAASTVWTSGDGWRIAGCPVNGPALALDGERAAVVWFTMAGGARPLVQCAFSSDGGRSFAPPVRVSSTDPLGRVDALFDAQGRLVVLWYETQGEHGCWRISRVDALEGPAGRTCSLGVEGPGTDVRARLVRVGESVFATDVARGRVVLRTLDLE